MNDADHAHPHTRPTDDCSAMIGGIIACFSLLVCRVIADNLFWRGERADEARHERVTKAR
jgi:hypothetical protein